MSYKSTFHDHNFPTRTFSHWQPTSTSSSTTQNRYTWTNSATGGENLEWREDIRARRSATTSFSGTKYSVSASPGSIETHYNVALGVNPPVYGRYRKSDGYLLLRGVSMPPAAPAGLESIAEQIAREKFYKHLRDQQTAFAGGVFLGELRETLHLLTNPAKALRRSFDNYFGALKERKARSRRDNKRILQETYLEWAFGWRLLVNDIEDAREILAKRRDFIENDVLFCSGKGEASDAARQSLCQITNGFSLKWRPLHEYTTTVRYRAAVKTNRSGNPPLTRQVLGLTLRDFVPTAYNLIPGSFVLDYFTGIGNVVDAYALRTTALAWAYRTRRSTAISRPTEVDIDWPSGVGYVHYSRKANLGDYRIERKTVSRGKVDSVPVPGISFRLPGFGLKWLNLAALATTHRSLTRYY